MSFFISDAYAQAEGAASAGLGSLLPLIIMVVLFYLLLIRPQMKRQKEHKQMVEALGKGDEVVTNGGVLGKITEVGDNFVVVEIADKVEVKIQKQAIAQVMPKGTIKAS